MNLANPFGDLTVRIDPWDVEYGAEVVATDHTAEDVSEDVALDVECQADPWTPLAHPDSPDHEEVFFVDGVRRVELRISVTDAHARNAFGAFGSYGVGFVRVVASTAEFGDCETGHVVATGGGMSLPETVTVRTNLAYRPVSTIAADPDAPGMAIHAEMRVAEERIGKELADTPNRLVIIDGPLSFEDPVRGDAVGYIKRIMKLYLAGSSYAVLTRLPAGHRTPLFAIRSSKRFARYAWYLRLSDPRLGDSDLSGIVRLEVAESVGLDRAVELADATARIVPAFQAKRGLHPRAPQNLLPIGALENRLRRELGDVRLIRRQIEDFITKEAIHV